MGIVPRPEIPKEFFVPPSLNSLIDDCLISDPSSRASVELIVVRMQFVMIECSFFDMEIA